VIVDYGCPRLFTAIVLTNGNDGGSGTRTTGAFTVYGSNDFINKTVLVSDTLPNPGANPVSSALLLIKITPRGIKEYMQNLRCIG
jgi:hypothetical protein